MAGLKAPHMRMLLLLLLVVAVAGTVYARRPRLTRGLYETYASPPKGAKWSTFAELVEHMDLAFRDKFDKLEPHWVLANEHTGGGNWERQAYMPSQVRVANNKLVITAELPAPGEVMPKVPPSPSTTNADGVQVSYPTQYKSGKVQATKGIPSGAVRFKLKPPVGKGMWPAAWLLPVYGSHPAAIATRPGDIGSAMPCWPDANLGPTCDGGGEIDVLELGFKDKPDTAMQTIHVGTSFEKHKYYSVQSTNGPFAGKWREYGVAWDADGIAWFIDNKLTAYWSWSDPAVLQGAPLPFVGRGHLYAPILNLAIGGNQFAPDPDASTRFPATLEVSEVSMWTWTKKRPGLLPGAALSAPAAGACPACPACPAAGGRWVWTPNA